MTAPISAECIRDAENFIQKVAPSLPANVRCTLAQEVVASVEKGSGKSTCLDHPVLLPYKEWYWPELVKVAPFSVSTSDYEAASCWRHEQHEAWRMAQECKKEREETTFREWLWRVSAVQARCWQRALISKEFHTRRRMFILFHLAAVEPVPPLILNDFQEWKAELQKAENDYLIEAAQPPTPRHLRKLSELVATHVQAQRFLTTAMFSPPSFARLEQVLAQKGDSVNDLDFESLHANLARSIMQPCWDQQTCRDAVLDAQQRLIKLRATLANPIDKNNLLAELRPVMIRVNQCPTCNRLSRTSKQPASHLLCRCQYSAWVSRSEVDDQSGDKKTQRHFHLWALHELCGFAWEPPTIALIVHQDMLRIEAQINAIAGERECARQTQQAHGKAQATHKHATN